jgi:excisionase family DNA binding protein
MLKKLINVGGAAEVLAISPWTVRAYVRQGRLTPVRIGRLVRFEEEELSRFIAEAGAQICGSKDRSSQ